MLGIISLAVAITIPSVAYATELHNAKAMAQEVQDTAIDNQIKLLREYTEYNNAPESKYGVNDVVAGNEGKFVLAAYKANGKHAKKTLSNNSYTVHIDHLTLKELNDYVSDTSKDNTAKLDAVKSLQATESSIASSHRLRLITDAQAKLKASVDKANATLNESSKVDDNTPRQNLQNAVNEASKLLHENNVKTLNANTSDVDGKIQAVKDAIQARNARLAREEAARQAAAAAARQATVQSNSRQASHDNSRYSGSTGTNNRRATGNNGYWRSHGSSYSHAVSRPGSSYNNGFSIGGSCSLDSADHCQGAVDSSGHNSLTHLTDDSGTNIYAIHSNYGGSSTWGQNSITINGKTHSLGAPFQTNVTPMDGKQYFQTCGPDGKVYLRQMN